jgi:broad specificity phosphatase PhoE
MDFEIIFVRHGESCANAWQKEFLSGSQILYGDPELTRRGIERCKVFREPLEVFIQEKWSDKPYIVGASALMRTQLTAFWQLARDSLGVPNGQTKPINVFPHICEPGRTWDNIPFDSQKQKEIIKSREILERLEDGNDYRDQQTRETQSNMLLFLKFLGRNPNVFAIGPDGVRRGVVFTHSHFLKKNFQLPTNDNIMNNGFIYTKFRVKPQIQSLEEFQGQGDFNYPYFQFFDLPDYPKEKYMCPDLCRKTLCTFRKDTHGLPSAAISLPPPLPPPPPTKSWFTNLFTRKNKNKNRNRNNRNKNNRNTRKRVDPRILSNSTYAQQLSQGANKGAGVGPLYRQPNNVYRENRGFALNGLGPQNFNEQGYIPKRQILQPEGASVRQ